MHAHKIMYAAMYVCRVSCQSSDYKHVQMHIPGHKKLAMPIQHLILNLRKVGITQACRKENLCNRDYNYADTYRLIVLLVITYYDSNNTQWRIQRGIQGCTGTPFWLHHRLYNLWLHLALRSIKDKWNPPFWLQN